MSGSELRHKVLHAKECLPEPTSQIETTESLMFKLYIMGWLIGLTKAEVIFWKSMNMGIGVWICRVSQSVGLAGYNEASRNTEMRDMNEESIIPR